MQVWWRTHLSFWHYVKARYDESTAVTTDARAIAERYGLEAYMFEIDQAEASALVNKGEYAAAKARLETMERGLSPARRMKWPFLIMFARCSSSVRPAGGVIAGRGAGGRAGPRIDPAVHTNAPLPGSPRAGPRRDPRSGRRVARRG